MFFSRRIYGIENEFGVIIEFPDKSISDPLSTPDNHMRLRQIKDSIIVRQSLEDHHHVWHSNGSCTYIDTGEHPEHATPECLSARDIVCYNKAGEHLCRQMFDRDSAGDNRILLFKNNLGYDRSDGSICGEYGCHENYSLNFRDCRKELTVLKPLLAFLATRQIFDGAGWWQKNGDFHLSQRALSIHTQVGHSASADRSFLQLKTGDTGSTMRLHVVSGDANICEFATYLKIGTMSLVISLLESNCCPVVPGLQAVHTLKAVSHHADPLAYVIQTEDRRMSAWEIQRLFFEAVRGQLPNASYDDEHIEHEVIEIMHLWEQALNAIYNRDTNWMRGRIDWATKKYLAETKVKRNGITNPAEIYALQKDIDILYHGISDPTLHCRMNKRWADRRIVTDSEIEHAIHHAPQNTRARMRGMFVEKLYVHHIHWANSVNWSQFGFIKDTQHYYVTLPDAHVSHSEKFNQFLAVLG